MYQFFATLPTIVCTFWTVILLLLWTEKRRPEHGGLTLFMAVTAVLYACHAVYFLQFGQPHPWVEAVYRACNLAVYPLYLIYIEQLTRGDVDKKSLLMLVPAALAGLASAAMPAFDAPPYAVMWLQRICAIVFIIIVGDVCLQGLRMLRDYRQRVADFYADTECRMLLPVRLLLILLSLTTFVSIVCSIIGRQQFGVSADRLPLALPSLVFSALLFAIGYVGQHDLSYVTEMDSQPLQPEERAEKPQTAIPAATSERVVSALLAEKIEKLMKEEKFYLTPDLKVSDVARKLGTNSKYVSVAINEELGLTFSAYVNSLRIAYAKRLHEEQPSLTIGEVALRAGYTSMTSFYRNMKLFS